jgi:hypothetical protein
MNKDAAQALVELLMLTIYLDDHMSVPENETLEKALSSLGWSMNHGGPVDVGAAYRVAHAAHLDPVETERFLAERTAVLREAGETTAALEWLGMMLGSDGMAPAEESFFNRVRGLLLG